MTPMIDVVFNLIIFFMIVTDLTQQELEDLVLPKADMAQKDENPEEKRIIININRKGEYIHRRKNFKCVDDAIGHIRDHLSTMVKNFPREKGPGDPSMWPSEQPVLIRADFKTEFKYIQKVMQICAEKGILIYKIELACSVAKDEDKK